MWFATNHIYDHLANCNLLSKALHGFAKRRSTCTNLLESVSDWTLTERGRKAVTIAYVDFSRAFDSVTHVKLLAVCTLTVFVGLFLHG